MKRALFALIAGCVVSGVAAFAAGAQSAAPRISITRLDCGTVQVNDLDAFSDTHAYVGQSKTLTDSCYLVRHGEDLMLWDTGLPAALKGKPVSATEPMSATVRATVAEQLARLGVRPEQVGRIGISHRHFDHVGQAAAFPGATLLIGAADADALRAGAPEAAAPLARWLTGGGKLEAVRGDKDVFGDGSVVMLNMPGHTPGHHSLLVRLKGRGDVLLTGDLAHFQRNYDTDGVPGFNTDRADTLASFDRFKKMAANLKATVVIQHEPADVAKLPAFPQAAD